MRPICSRRRQVVSALAAILNGVLLGSPADGAAIELLAVRLNDEEIEPASHLFASPGDVVDVEFYVSGWGNDIDTVKTWQVTMDVEGYFSGIQGTVMPLGWHAPFVWRECQSDETCGGGVCSELCVYRRCNSDADCPAPWRCLLSGSNTLCFGVDHEPSQGAFIDEARPDFVFSAFPNVILAVRTAFFPYAFGATLFLDDGPLDDGGMYYLCTLRLVVSDDARGTFTVGIDNSPYTFLTDPSRQDARFVVEPVVIEVAHDVATDPGACCRGRRSCEDLTRSECLELGGRWQAGQACGVGKQTCLHSVQPRTRVQE